MCSARDKTHSAVGDRFLRMWEPTAFSPSFDVLRFHAKTTHCCAQIAFLALAFRRGPGKAARESRAQRQGVLRATSRERQCSRSAGSPSPGPQLSRSFASEFFPARLSPLRAGGQGEPTHAGEGEPGRGATATPAAQRGSASEGTAARRGRNDAGPAGLSRAAGLLGIREARTTGNSAQEAAAEPLHRRPADGPSTAPLRAKLRRRERALRSASPGRGKLRRLAQLALTQHQERPHHRHPPHRSPPSPSLRSPIAGHAATAPPTAAARRGFRGRGGHRKPDTGRGRGGGQQRQAGPRGQRPAQPPRRCSRRRICRHRPRRSRAARKRRRPPSPTDTEDEDRARRHSAG